MSNLIQTGFDYAALPMDVALKAQLAANSIKLRLKRTVEDIIEIGRELTAVKAELLHGQFLPWIAAEFEMHENTARSFMQVSERFGEFTNFVDFKPSVLYALAALSTPEAVIDKAVAKAESGEKVTVADVKDWKALEAGVDTSQIDFVDLEAERQATDLAKRNAELCDKISQLEIELEIARAKQVDEPHTKALPVPVTVAPPLADEERHREQERLAKEDFERTQAGKHQYLDQLINATCVCVNDTQVRIFKEHLDWDAFASRYHHKRVDTVRVLNGLSKNLPAMIAIIENAR